MIQYQSSARKISPITSLQIIFPFWQQEKDKNAMTKAELIQQMAEGAGILKPESAKALASLLDRISKSY